MVIYHILFTLCPIRKNIDVSKDMIFDNTLLLSYARTSQLKKKLCY
jgi:hypothetical protein